MELSQISLNHGLTFLVYTTAIVLLFVGGFLLKLIFDLTKLVQNINETTNVLKSEIKPTLKGLNETVSTINAFVQSTEEHIDKIKNVVGDVFGVSSNALNKVTKMSGSLVKGLVKGFTTVFNLFRK